MYHDVFWRIFLSRTQQPTLQFSAYKAVSIAPRLSTIAGIELTFDTYPKSFTANRIKLTNPLLLFFCLGTSNVLYFLIHSLSSLSSTSRSKFNDLRIRCWGVATLKLEVYVSNVTECILSQILTAIKIAESRFLHQLKLGGFHAPVRF
jgi:hypothetical protein